MMKFFKLQPEKILLVLHFVKSCYIFSSLFILLTYSKPRLRWGQVTGPLQQRTSYDQNSVYTCNQYIFKDSSLLKKLIINVLLLLLHYAVLQSHFLNVCCTPCNQIFLRFCSTFIILQYT